MTCICNIRSLSNLKLHSLPIIREISSIPSQNVASGGEDEVFWLPGTRNEENAKKMHARARRFYF